ncbi:hypothetical protein B0H13DRAFT_1856027 [Mycena leptocephala]|nr:hypothetical protein B0H13DRAFT_1856027 [Mycena leptocephala]
MGFGASFRCGSPFSVRRCEFSAGDYRAEYRTWVSASKANERGRRTRSLPNHDRRRGLSGERIIRRKDDSDRHLTWDVCGTYEHQLPNYKRTDRASEAVRHVEACNGVEIVDYGTGIVGADRRVQCAGVNPSATSAFQTEGCEGTLRLRRAVRRDNVNSIDVDDEIKQFGTPDEYEGEIMIQTIWTELASAQQHRDRRGLLREPSAWSGCAGGLRGSSTLNASHTIARMRDLKRNFGAKAETGHLGKGQACTPTGAWMIWISRSAAESAVMEKGAYKRVGTRRARNWHGLCAQLSTSSICGSCLHRLAAQIIFGHRLRWLPRVEMGENHGSEMNGGKGRAQKLADRNEVGMDARLDHKHRDIYKVGSDAGLDKKRRESGTEKTGEKAAIEGTDGWSGIGPAQGRDSRQKQDWYSVTSLSAAWPVTEIKRCGERYEERRKAGTARVYMDMGKRICVDKTGARLRLKQRGASTRAVTDKARSRSSKWRGWAYIPKKKSRDKSRSWPLYRRGVGEHKAQLPAIVSSRHGRARGASPGHCIVGVEARESSKRHSRPLSRRTSSVEARESTKRFSWPLSRRADVSGCVDLRDVRDRVTRNAQRASGCVWLLRSARLNTHEDMKRKDGVLGRTGDGSSTVIKVQRGRGKKQV